MIEKRVVEVLLLFDRYKNDLLINSWKYLWKENEMLIEVHYGDAFILLVNGNSRVKICLKK